MSKKIIIPTGFDIQKYSNKEKKLEELAQNPLDKFIIKDLNTKKIKNKFCSTIKVFSNWKEFVKNILNNSDYKNDKR